MKPLHSISTVHHKLSPVWLNIHNSYSRAIEYYDQSSSLRTGTTNTNLWSKLCYSLSRYALPRYTLLCRFPKWWLSLVFLTIAGTMSFRYCFLFEKCCCRIVLSLLSYSSISIFLRPRFLRSFIRRVSFESLLLIYCFSMICAVEMSWGRLVVLLV